MLQKKVFFLGYLLFLFVAIVSFTALTEYESTTAERANRVDAIEFAREAGEATYSGEWKGTLGKAGFFMEYNGTWQFEVNFREGKVEGRFRGDGAGDITGTVSDGIVEATGKAAFGAVQWYGEFSSDRQNISGSWNIIEAASEFGEGSGTWTGSLGELEQETSKKVKTKKFPQEDQTEVDEAFERYPGSVALNYKSMRPPQGAVTIIDYATEDSLEDVVDWYERKLGEPTIAESSKGKTKLGYRLDAPAGWIEIEISTNDYTTIKVEHVKIAN